MGIQEARMTILQVIEKIQKSKEKIREAIRSKGVEVSDTATLDELADKIAEIKVAKSIRRKNG